MKFIFHFPGGHVDECQVVSGSGDLLSFSIVDFVGEGNKYLEFYGREFKGGIYQFVARGMRRVVRIKVDGSVFYYDDVISGIDKHEALGCEIVDE